MPSALDWLDHRGSSDDEPTPAKKGLEASVRARDEMTRTLDEVQGQIVRYSRGGGYGSYTPWQDEADQCAYCGRLSSRKSFASCAGCGAPKTRRPAAL